MVLDIKETQNRLQFKVKLHTLYKYRQCKNNIFNIKLVISMHYSNRFTMLCPNLIFFFNTTVVIRVYF